MELFSRKNGFCNLSLKFYVLVYIFAKKTIPYRFDSHIFVTKYVLYIGLELPNN